MRNAVRSLVVCLAVLGASDALAQERGRTDGPEGSEVGKGGYVSGPAGSGGFSLTADGGGAITIKGPQFSPPLFAGLTASYWNADFYRIDLSGFYMPDPKLWGVLLGPSFHTTTWPIAFSIGFQARSAHPQRRLGEFHPLPACRNGLDHREPLPARRLRELGSESRQLRFLHRPRGPEHRVALLGPAS